MGSFKIDYGFLRTFLIVSAMILLLVGTSLWCAHTQRQSMAVPNICNKALINPDGVHLNVPILIQGTDCGWCWAADIAMLGTFYSKRAIPICGIVTHTTTITVTATTATGTIAKRLDCCLPNSCATPCNHGGSDKQVMDGFLFVGYPHKKISGVISENHLKVELSRSRPVMQEIESATGRHVRVIAGFTPPKPPATDATFDVLDSNYVVPLNRTYNQLIVEPKDIAEQPYVWKETWVLTSTAAPECK